MKEIVAALVAYFDLGFVVLLDRCFHKNSANHSNPPTRRNHRGWAYGPRAGDGYDKGHALSHAQGGLEGGPNYFKQKRGVNQRRSGAGTLWRDIETHLAANAGVFAFVRLIYRPGETGEMPFEPEYGILNGPGQFRAVIFPNR